MPAHTQSERTLLLPRHRGGGQPDTPCGRPAIVAKAEALVTDAHAEVVQAFLATNDLRAAELG